MFLLSSVGTSCARRVHLWALVYAAVSCAWLRSPCSAINANGGVGAHSHSKVGGTLWFAPHAAHTSTYAPFPCGMDVIPHSYSNSSGWGAINRGVAAWANRYVFNMAQLRFSAAIEDIGAVRAGLDTTSLALQSATDQAYTASPTNATMATIGSQFAQNADDIVAAWWKLADMLMVKYADGGGHRGYPSWWLASNDVGYTQPL